MISFCLTLLLTTWSVGTLWTVDRVLIPLIAQRLADRDWRRLHPEMPLERRPLA
jgi:hypothetical protein